jgi:hypothetical protein
MSHRKLTPMSPKPPLFVPSANDPHLFDFAESPESPALASLRQQGVANEGRLADLRKSWEVVSQALTQDEARGRELKEWVRAKSGTDIQCRAWKEEYQGLIARMEKNEGRLEEVERSGATLHNDTLALRDRFVDARPGSAGGECPTRSNACRCSPDVLRSDVARRDTETSQDVADGRLATSTTAPSQDPEDRTGIGWREGVATMRVMRDDG